MVEDQLLDHQLIYNEQVARFTLEDFEIMLSQQGLQIKEVLGDYNLSPYDVIKSPRLIVIAAKKNSQ